MATDLFELEYFVFKTVNEKKNIYEISKLRIYEVNIFNLF